jgi:NAD(P)H-hydrate epimerase
LGELIVVQIGLEDHSTVSMAEKGASRIVLVDDALVRGLLPRRAPESNKGSHGKALIVAGCADFPGAPTLSARAAYRVGAGLVAYAVPKSVATSATIACPEATFVPLPDSIEVLVAASAPRVVEWLRTAGAGASVVIGPGLGQAAETAAFLDRFLVALNAAELGTRGVVCDADALNLLSSRRDGPACVPPLSVLTPHPGEMARLAGTTVAAIQADRIGNAVRFAAGWGHVVLLKGAFTVVASPDGRGAVLPYANPAMAVAGMGDALAGSIAGLLAQGLAPFEAAVAGAFLHGAAGERWRLRRGEAGLLASDLISLLPDAIRALKQGDLAA